MVRGNVQAISTSIEPSSLFVTDGVEVDGTEMSINGKRTVLERLVMGGERGLRRKCPVLFAKWRSGETRTATALSLHFWLTLQMRPVSFRPHFGHRQPPFETTVCGPSYSSSSRRPASEFHRKLLE
ncbi:hypothetical protein CPY51_10095 [Rhizobium tubonense]|uniref:Uncharacterized protein n=1 Tax=Rhizobium tubonense TaxID=484088 RepID=A0A2W4EV17_9HYPH|nr:hypothetical protein CPY51_10095 [Rhizobium tubonense]